MPVELLAVVVPELRWVGEGSCLDRVLDFVGRHHGLWEIRKDRKKDVGLIKVSVASLPWKCSCTPIKADAALDVLLVRHAR